MSNPSSHHHQLCADAVEPVDLVHRLALDLHLAVALESESDEERGRGVEVLDDNTHMIETQHALDHSSVS